MKVLLVSANTEQINMPTLPLGMACIAAATRLKGHEVEVIDLMAEMDSRATIKKVIEGFQPEIIGISVRNIDDQDMEIPKFLLDPVREVVEACRSFSSAPIVLGGAGYSIFPESALTYLGADMGIQGEGEWSFLLLIKSIQEGLSLSEVPGLYLPGRGLQGRRAFARKLDDFPLPDIQLISTSQDKGTDFWLPVQTRRGCPIRCSYCSTETIEGCLIRKRSPETIVQWLARCVEAGVRGFHFVDNTFNLPPSYADALCSRIIEADLNIRWRCILYPGNLDEALVRKMAEAGCMEVSLGFESGSDRILETMNKRFKSRDVALAARMLGDYGIQRMGFLMLGGPRETRTTVEESLSFVQSLDLETLKLTIGIRIYPYTKLARMAVEEGRIAADDTLLFPKFYLAKGTEEWLRRTVDACLAEHPNWIN